MGSVLGRRISRDSTRQTLGGAGNRPVQLEPTVCLDLFVLFVDSAVRTHPTQRVATGGTWNALLLLFASRLSAGARVKGELSLLVLVMAATAQVLVSSDVSRVVVAGFPAMVAICALEVDRLTPHATKAWHLLWLSVFLAQFPWLVAFALPPASVPFIGWASAGMLPCALGIAGLVSFGRLNAARPRAG